jgi:hypothetical protein
MRRVVGLAAVIAGACGAQTKYTPTMVAPGELTLRYDDGLEVWAGRAALATAPRFSGLAETVECVPRAREHAQRAAAEGRRATGLAWAGGVLGVSALGGLSGLAFLERDRVLAFSLLGAGVALGITGVVLAASSLGPKNRANGHAVDAVNFYNDEIGSLGGTCRAPPLPPVPIPIPAVPGPSPP